MKNWSRKDFLKASLLGGGAALVAGHTRLYGQAAPAAGSANGDIRVAVVGLGVSGQGAGHMKDYLNKLPGARLVAICDVDSEILAKHAAACEKAGVKPTTYADYRKLLEDKNIDAVVLATPNHQHSLQSIWGLQAGKDVYCEKPLSHNVWEGRQVVEAAKKYPKNIIQAGTQNRSSDDIKAAIEQIKSGKLGKIQWARALCYKERASIGKTTGPQTVPASIDYNMWSGPAEVTPPRRNSPQRGPVHYDWHWFWNYGGGDITNQGIHQMDVARWMLGAQGLPASVMTFGGRFGYQDDAETPNTLVSVLGYQSAPLIFEVRGLPKSSTEKAVAGKRQMDRYRAAQVGVIVQCENGYVHVTEGGNAVIYDNNNQKIQTLADGGNGNHRANFVKAVQSRKVVNGLVDECHYSSALCHLANVSYLVGTEKSNTQLADSIKSDANTKDSFARMLDHLKANEVNVETTKTTVGPLLKIDGKTEMFTGSEPFVKAANNNILRKREGRGEFKIPVIKAETVAAS